LGLVLRHSIENHSSSALIIIIRQRSRDLFAACLSNLLDAPKPFTRALYRNLKTYFISIVYKNTNKRIKIFNTIVKLKLGVYPPHPISCSLLHLRSSVHEDPKVFSTSEVSSQHHSLSLSQYPFIVLSVFS